MFAQIKGMVAKSSVVKMENGKTMITDNDVPIIAQFGRFLQFPRAQSRCGAMCRRALRVNNEPTNSQLLINSRRSFSGVYCPENAINIF